MQLWFNDPVSIAFFVVMVGYLLVLTVVTFLPLRVRKVPHHYQIGFAVLLAAIIPLVFLRKVGENDLIVATFWGCIIMGIVSILLDFHDLKTHAGQARVRAKGLNRRVRKRVRRKKEPEDFY